MCGKETGKRLVEVHRRVTITLWKDIQYLRHIVAQGQNNHCNSTNTINSKLSIGQCAAERTTKQVIIAAHATSSIIIPDHGTTTSKLFSFLELTTGVSLLLFHLCGVACYYFVIRECVCNILFVQCLSLISIPTVEIKEKLRDIRSNHR